MRVLLLLVLVACTSKPHALPPAAQVCATDADCARGEQCVCRGVGEDPCSPEMTDEDCTKARCGGRVCSAGIPVAPH